jgi:hypothetical protein
MANAQKRAVQLELGLKALNDKNGDEFFIAEEFPHDMTINLKDWAILVFPPPEGQNHGGTLIFKQRIPKGNQKKSAVSAEGDPVEEG